MERNKGNSIISLPDDYCVIDLETTGLDPSYDRIIELAALRVRGKQVVAQYAHLVNPGRPIDSFISMLTGITNEMVQDAPPIEDLLPEYLDFIGDDIVVGHNVPFDVNFIYDNLLRISGKCFQNDHVNTVRIARKLHPDFESHTLSELKSRLTLHATTAHRALADCLTTNELYIKLYEEVSEKFDSPEEFFVLFKKHKRAASSHGMSMSAQSLSQLSEFKEMLQSSDETHPLYGKICVFTGKLDMMTRDVAQEIVTMLGGIPADRVTAKTNYLILGRNDYCSSIKDGKSRKQKKAEELSLKGCDIQIISENVFYDMIFE